VIVLVAVTAASAVKCRMAKYFDTGSGDPAQFPGHWLQEHLTADTQGFRCQFGYFRYEAVAPFSGALQSMALAGHPVHFVLGSNGGTLLARDAQSVLRVAAGPASSLTVVAFSNAEFHPKSIHLTRNDGSAIALVGSGNFTQRGFGVNVEAAVELDSEHDGVDLLHEVASAIDRWRGIVQDGVFRIVTDADVQALADDNIVNVPVPTMAGAAGAPTGRRGMGRRNRGWRPQGGARVRAVPNLIPAPQPVSLPLPPPQPPVIALRWCKELASSDAQQVKPGTNTTGKLRLSQSGFPIGHTTWFRNTFFGAVLWRQENTARGLKEAARVPFSVKVRGVSLGTQTLTIDHATYRIAGQGNVATVLAWGRVLMQELTRTDHQGDWVVLSCDTTGHFALTIQEAKPHWAP
jgi:hypothetical protein